MHDAIWVKILILTRIFGRVMLPAEVWWTQLQAVLKVEGKAVLACILVQDDVCTLIRVHEHGQRVFSGGSARHSYTGCPPRAAGCTVGLSAEKHPGRCTVTDRHVGYGFNAGLTGCQAGVLLPI